MAVKAIFFDLGETLVTQNIEDNIVTRRALVEVARMLPTPASGIDLFRIYQRGYKINHRVRSRHHVEIPIQTWMRELLTRVLGGYPPSRLIQQAIGTIVKRRATNAIAFKDARSTLEKLADHRFELGVISNVSSHEVAIEILRRVRLHRYFDFVVTSAQTGIRKPDPGIFLYALRQSKLKPREAVHVGDSEVHDVRGAKPVGMTTVLVRSRQGLFHTDADYQLRNLEGAADLLVSL